MSIFAWRLSGVPNLLLLGAAKAFPQKNDLIGPALSLKTGRGPSRCRNTSAKFIAQLSSSSTGRSREPLSFSMSVSMESLGLLLGKSHAGMDAALFLIGHLDIPRYYHNTAQGPVRVRKAPILRSATVHTEEGRPGTNLKAYKPKASKAQTP